MYEPQVNDYVVWTTALGMKHEGWVYFKGDPIDNEKRVKNKWNPIPRYITIEISVRPKSDVAREDPHKMIHTLLMCYEHNWHELKFVKKRTNKMCEHYSQYDDVHGNEDSVFMYKSQEHRYEDVQ